jgi:hypothetical protein
VRTSLLALALALASSGCIALSARAHVGAVTSEVGSGVQGGIALGFGFSTSEQGAVIASGGVATGTPKIGLVDTIEYVRVPEDEDDVPLAWRAGAGGVLALRGAPTIAGVHFAGMFLLRHTRSRDAGHEKFGGGGTTHNALGIGVEGRVGFAARDIEDSPMPGEIRRDRSLGASASLTLEWITIARMKL